MYKKSNFKNITYIEYWVKISIFTSSYLFFWIIDKKSLKFQTNYKTHNSL